MECVVTNSHKGHEIRGIVEAAVQGKALFFKDADRKVKESTILVREEKSDLKQVEVLIST